jgi:poly(A) polymerase
VPERADQEIAAGAVTIIRRLRQAGHQALLAGGCVRDWLMGRRPKDWDIATDAAPEQVTALFARTVPVGAKYGVVLVRAQDGEYEVARFRRDGVYLDGRRPEAVEFVDAEQDAQRRDFTINGMFYDPVAGRLLDYVGGQADIERRCIRAIGKPEQRFAEDYLRMLRAVRFSARLGFEIEAETFAACANLADRINEISPERIRGELDMILTEGGAAAGFELLQQSGLLAQILPEVSAMDGVAQPPEFHPEGDVWTHVKIMLGALQNPEKTLAWGVLLHDIGKPVTFEMADRIRFNGHDAIGARMAEQICRRLHMTHQDTKRIQELVAGHMQFRNVKQMRQSRLKRFLRTPHFGELLELHRIDCLSSHGLHDLYDFCVEQLEGAGEQDLQPVSLVNGRDLIAMGFAPGPVFKKILLAVEDEQLEGRLHSREDGLNFVAERFGVGSE